MKRDHLPPPAQLMMFIVGKWISKSIYVAAELSIADMLSEGSKTIEELARETRSHGPSLYRMMRALASVGIFSEAEGRRFALTPMAECLKHGAMRSAALLFNSQWSDQAWGSFPGSMKTGKPAFEKAHGMPFFQWLGNHPGAAEIFNEANAFKAAASHRAIVDVYDFSDIQRLTDIGGGTGALMAEILVANPSMKGLVADIPSVIEKAKRYLQSRELEDRCKTVLCDFFKHIPAGSDAYLMSHILHDWPTERCKIILDNCRKAMKPGSRLLIAEMVVPLGNGPSMAKLLDLEMLVNGGCERTEAEFRTLLESSGFRLSRTMATQESVCLMEGIRL